MAGSDINIKLFIGTDAAGMRLKKAISKKAKEKDLSMSKLIVRDFCEKYGYDRKTGKHIVAKNQNRIGYPPRTHYSYDDPQVNEGEK